MRVLRDVALSGQTLASVPRCIWRLSSSAFAGKEVLDTSVALWLSGTNTLRNQPQSVSCIDVCPRVRTRDATAVRSFVWLSEERGVKGWDDMTPHRCRRQGCVKPLVRSRSMRVYLGRGLAYRAYHASSSG